MKYLIRTAEVQRFSNEINVNKGNSVSIWKAVRKALSEKPNQQLQYTKATKLLAEEFNGFFLHLLGKKLFLLPHN